MRFTNLVNNICEIDQNFQSRTIISINQNLIIRNWLFGFYIIEFEQNGSEYAQYGKRLLYQLADGLKSKGIKGVSYTNLTMFRRFFLLYPQIGDFIRGNNYFSNHKKITLSNLQPLAEDLSNVSLPAKTILENFSFTHLTELLKIEDNYKKLFYEIECIKGGWSKRQLKRQINSMLYERVGLSENKEELLSKIEISKVLPSASDIIRDPYVFEFLGLKVKDVFEEKDLEEALLNHLQNFY